MTSICIKRGTRAQLDSAATGGQLKQGEQYLITDENRLAIGLGAGTYEALPKSSEAGGGGSGVAVVDFGADPVCEKTFSISNAALTTGSVIHPFVMVESTADNDAESHRHAAASWRLAAQAAAGGFTLYVSAMADLCWGTFKIRYTFS